MIPFLGRAIHLCLKGLNVALLALLEEGWICENLCF